MPHLDIQAALAEDRPFLARIAASGAGLGVKSPLGWAFENAWKFAVTPDWCCEVDAAPEKGSAAISDDLIRPVVEAFLADHPPTPTPSE